MEHVKHECHDYDCYVCSSGLLLCSVCGGAEGSLPTECCGVRMTNEQQDNIMAKKLDYVNGEWVKKTDIKKGSIVHRATACTMEGKPLLFSEDKYEVTSVEEVNDFTWLCITDLPNRDGYSAVKINDVKLAD